MKRLIAILLIVSQAWGDVTFDAAGTATDNAAVVTSSNTSLTVGSGSNRALIGKVCWTGVPTNVDNAFWDTAGSRQKMTLVSSGTTTTNTQTCALYGLVAPTSGNKTFNVTWIGSQECMTQLVSWTNVDQTGGVTTFHAAPKGTGTGTQASVTIASAIGNATVDAIGTGTSSILNSVSLIQTYRTSGSGALESGGSRHAGDVTVVSTGTSAGSQAWVAIGTDIVAAATAASTTGSSKKDKLTKMGEL